MITLTDSRRVVMHGSYTAFTVRRDGAPIGTAFRHDSGPRRGIYTFRDYTGSRALLIKHLEA
jgi:hypothetical protein